MIMALQLAHRKQSAASLIVALAFCAAPAFAAVTPKVEGLPLLSVKVGSSLPSDLLLAQAQAPGRPTTPEEQRKLAPEKPVKDKVAPKEPPPPGRPNFPQRPANEPPLTNPLNK